MNGTVRAAQAADVPAMADLAERRRVEYQRFQPTFWRKAADSRARQLPYFERLVGSEDHIALVYERAGAIAGFILGALIPAPPVYDPGGPTCLVDDFTVAAAESWELVGSAPLRAARQEARRRGAVQLVVVCAHLDRPKRAMLRSSGFSIASEWYVGDV